MSLPRGTNARRSGAVRRIWGALLHAFCIKSHSSQLWVFHDRLHTILARGNAEDVVLNTPVTGNPRRHKDARAQVRIRQATLIGIS